MTQFLSVTAEGGNDPSVLMRTPEGPQEQKLLYVLDLFLSRGGLGGRWGGGQEGTGTITAGP